MSNFDLKFVTFVLVIQRDQGNFSNHEDRLYLRVYDTQGYREEVLGAPSNIVFCLSMFSV